MKPSDNLFILIQSLSKSEKKYFKRFCRLYSSDKKNNYIKLFDYIENQTFYDEIKLKQYFQKENFSKHLSVIKDYLYKLILKSLVLQRSSAELAYELKESVMECDILVSRGMYNQSRKRIKKTKEILNKYGYNLLLLELLSIEKYTINNLNKYQKKSVLDQIIDEEKKVISQISRNSEIANLKRKLMINLSEMGMPVRNNDDILKMNRFIKSLEKRTVSSSLSSHSRSVLYHTKIAAYISVTDYLNAYKDSIKLIKLLKSSSELILKDPKNMYGALHNLVFLTLNLKNKLKTLKYLNELRSYINKIEFKYSKEIYYNIYLNYFNLELSVDNRFFNLNSRDDRILQFKEFCKKNKSYINQSYYLNSSALLVTNYLVHSEWEKALAENNRLMNLKKEYVSREQNYHAQINSFIIHYELKNFELLENQIIRFYNLLKINKGINELELTAAKYFKKLINKINISEIKEIFIEFGDKLETLKKTPSINQVLNDYFLPEWIKSKIENRPLNEIIKLNN